MEPLIPDPAQLPLVNVTVPIHITREVAGPMPICLKYAARKSAKARRALLSG